jgi:hypothetical protein
MSAPTAAPRRRWSAPGRWLAAAAVLAVLATVAGAGWYVLRHRDDLGAIDRIRDPATAGPPRTEPLRIQLPVNAAELGDADLARALDKARAAGATEIGGGVAWWFVTQGRAPDQYDWSAVDRLVAAASARGMAVRLQLTGTPDAAHPETLAQEPDHDRRIWYPPRGPGQLAQWARFVGDTVRRYAGRVGAVELWNEPNIDEFWAPSPEPAAYAALLEAGYRAAKQADPSIQVVFAGLSHNDVGYLQRFYADARRAFPEAASHHYFFDVLDVHPYTDGRSPDDTSPDTVVLGRYGPVDKSLAGLRLMKAVMDRQEGSAGGGKRIVIGEFGYTTTGTETAAAVPDPRRAYFLKRALALAADMGFLTGVTWYGYLPDSSNDPGWSIASPRSYDGWTYRALADAADGSAPVTVTLPATIRPGPGPVRPALTGLTERDVEHVELWVDGVLRAEADGASVVWQAGGSFAGGRVQLAVYTRDGHVWPSSVATVPDGD